MVLDDATSTSCSQDLQINRLTLCSRHPKPNNINKINNLWESCIQYLNFELLYHILAELTTQKARAPAGMRCGAMLCAVVMTEAGRAEKAGNTLALARCSYGDLYM